MPGSNLEDARGLKLSTGKGAMAQQDMLRRFRHSQQLRCLSIRPKLHATNIQEQIRTEEGKENVDCAPGAVRGRFLQTALEHVPFSHGAPFSHLMPLRCAGCKFPKRGCR